MLRLGRSQLCCFIWSTSVGSVLETLLSSFATAKTDTLWNFIGYSKVTDSQIPDWLRKASVLFILLKSSGINK